MKDIIVALEGMTLSMKAHPDCQPDSEFQDMVDRAEKALNNYHNSPPSTQEEPTTQKELTLQEIHELKSVGLISDNWYAVRHEDNKIPIAILCNEAYANAYRDQFSATSVVEPWPMIVSDIRKPIKQIFSNEVISSEPTQEELWKALLRKAADLRNAPPGSVDTIEELKQHFEIKRKKS